MIGFLEITDSKGVWIVLMLVVLSLFVTIGAYAQSKSEIYRKKIPREKGIKMVADVLDAVGGKSESDTLKMQITAGGQPSSIGKSQGADHKILAGYVYATGLPGITVISPNGGETWYGGDQHYITWSSENFAGDVRIDYSTNSGASFDSVIVSSYPDTGEYLWTVPYISSSRCRVRVCDAADSDPADMSDNDFTITWYGAPVLTNYGLVILLLLLIGSIIWMIRKRRLAVQGNV